MSKSYHHFINGQVVQGKSGRHSDIFNPSLGEVSGNVALATTAELNIAVAAAKAALPEWSGMNPQRRARVLFRFKGMVETKARSALATGEHRERRSPSSSRDGTSSPPAS